MANNETLIAIPLGSDLTDPERLRLFLLRLIEKLDIILGFRGNDPYVTQNELVITADTITEQIAVIQVGTEIRDVNAEEVEIDLTYVVERYGVVNTIVDSGDGLQDLANQVEALSNDVDALYAILRTAGIIS